MWRRTIVAAMRCGVLWGTMGGMLAVGPCQAAPEITVVTEPACHGEVIVITGEGLDPARTRVVAVALGAKDGGFDPQATDDPGQYLASIDRPPPIPQTPPKTAT